MVTFGLFLNAGNLAREGGGRAGSEGQFHWRCHPSTRHRRLDDGESLQQNHCREMRALQGMDALVKRWNDERRPQPIAVLLLEGSGVLDRCKEKPG